MGAGGYPTRFDWQRRTQGAADSFGQKVDQFAHAADVWGAVDDPSGGRTTRKESEGAEVLATVRVRGYPPVAAGDRLVEYGLGYTWSVLSAVRGPNEQVLDVKRPRWTAGGGLA